MTEQDKQRLDSIRNINKEQNLFRSQFRDLETTMDFLLRLLDESEQSKAKAVEILEKRWTEVHSEYRKWRSDYSQGQDDAFDESLRILRQEGEYSPSKETP